MPTCFWEQLLKELGEPVRRDMADFLTARGFPEEYEQCTSSTEEHETVADAVTEILRLRACFPVLTQHRTAGPPTVSGREDGRWALLSELERVREDYGAVPLPFEPFEPVRFSRVSRPWSMSPEQVRVTFDNRLSLHALITELRKEWPRLAHDRWLRRSRALEPRALDLLRFVCLQTPQSKTWRERLEEWDRTRPVKWRYNNVRTFQSAFRRAERALTGSPRGLEWFYSSDARRLSDPDLDNAWKELTTSSGTIARLEGENTPEAKRALDFERLRRDTAAHDIEVHRGQRQFESVIHLADVLIGALPAGESEPDKKSGDKPGGDRA